MTDSNDLSDRKPLTITGDATATCPRHGEMHEHVGIIRREPHGHIHVLRDGYQLFSCPECCIGVRRALPYDPPPGASAGMDDPNEAMLWVLFVFVHEKWDVIGEPFVDLGPGELVDQTDEDEDKATAGSIGFASTRGAQMTVDDEGAGQWESDVDFAENSRELHLERAVPPEEIPQWLCDYGEVLVIRGPNGVIDK